MPDRPLIALDGGPLAGPPGGIQRYTQELFKALPAAWPEVEFTLLSDQMEPKPKGIDKKWWLLGLHRELHRRKAALFHGTDFAVPYWPACPSVLTLHDLSPWREPSESNARVRNRTAWLLRLKIPALVHTPSEAIRREAHEFFGWPLERIAAVPHAAADHLRPVQDRVWERPYVLYVGTLEARKNLDVVIEAARELWARGEDFDLLLAGQERDGFRLEAGERVVKLGFVAEEKLAAFYSGAKCTVYPSRYEGFGLPVLEAMQCGSPMVASDIPVLRETGGGAALYAKSGEWAGQILNAMRSQDRAAMGIARASEFSWRRTALEMKAVYERAIG